MDVADSMDAQIWKTAVNIYAGFGVLGITSLILGLLFLWDRKRILRTLESDQGYIRNTLTGMLIDNAKIIGQCTMAFKDNAIASDALKNAIARIGELHGELGKVQGAVIEVGKQVEAHHQEFRDLRHDVRTKHQAYEGRLAVAEDRIGIANPLSDVKPLGEQQKQ